MSFIFRSFRTPLYPVPIHYSDLWERFLPLVNAEWHRATGGMAGDVPRVAVAEKVFTHLLDNNPGRRDFTDCELRRYAKMRIRHHLA